MLVKHQTGQEPPPTANPGFIPRLRQQRELTKAKRQPQDAKSNCPGNISSHEPYQAGTTAQRPNPGMVCASDIRQNTTPHQLKPSHPDGISGGDLFWLINRLDKTQVRNTNHLVNMDYFQLRGQCLSTHRMGGMAHLTCRI